MLGSVSKLTTSQVTRTQWRFKICLFEVAAYWEVTGAWEGDELNDDVILWMHGCVDHTLCLTCYLGSMECYECKYVVQWELVMKHWWVFLERCWTLKPKKQVPTYYYLSISCISVSLSSFSRWGTWHHQGEMSKVQLSKIFASYSDFSFTNSKSWALVNLNLHL